MQRHWGIKVSDVFKEILRLPREELWSLGEIIAGQGEGALGPEFEYFLRVLK